MSDLDNICMKCMSDLKNDNVCPNCGEKKGTPQEMPFLPKKTIIGSRYAVGSGLEITGEGLSYIGYDTVKNIKVYIREFFPANLCSRGTDFSNVAVPSYRKGIYEKELNKFLKYFRSVARLRNIPALCSVYDIFKENNTAYVIMEWIDGIKLDKFIGKKGGYISWNEIRSMIMPLLVALSDMHDAGVLHLGICPGNLFVTDDKKIRLSGFAVADLRNLGSPIEPQLYDGCSALEQYIEIYDADQSTDVYGFTASLFLCLTGEYPQTAQKRKKDDRLFIAKDIVRSIPDNVVSGMASGLRVYPNNRTLSFERLKAELSNSPVAQISLAKEKNITKRNKNRKDKNSNFVWGITSCCIALAVLIVCFVVYWFVIKKNEHNPASSENSTSEQSHINDLDEASMNKMVVPDLIGKAFSDIKSQNKSQTGYEVLVLSEEFDDEVEVGKIISQTPSAGEEMYEGSIIAVNVSKGSKMRQLPNISGKSISEASIALSNIGMIAVESWSYNNTVPEGIVVGYSNQKEGDHVEYGSEVVVVRSLGKNNSSS